MISRGQQRRLDYIAAGKCPCCAGREDLIPGMHFGLACQRKSQAKGGHRKPKPAVLLVPGASVWDPQPDGLTRAIRQAEQDLQAVG